MILYNLKPLEKLNWSIENGHFSWFCEKPKCIPSKHQNNCSIDEEKTCNNFLSLQTLWNIIQQLLCQSTTLLIGITCPISILKQKLTYLERIFTLFSLRCHLCIVHRKDCASVLRSFKNITYRTDERKKTVSTVEELGEFWEPGARDAVSPFVLNCSCFQV